MNDSSFLWFFHTWCLLWKSILTSTWAIVNVRAPKCSNYALTNFLCKFVWISELLVNLPNPISKPQHTLLPLKWSEPRSSPQYLFLPLSSPLDSQLTPSRSLKVRHPKCVFSPLGNHKTIFLKLKLLICVILLTPQNFVPLGGSHIILSFQFVLL